MPGQVCSVVGPVRAVVVLEALSAIVGGFYCGPDLPGTEKPGSEQHRYAEVVLRGLCSMPLSMARCLPDVSARCSGCAALLAGIAAQVPMRLMHAFAP